MTPTPIRAARRLSHLIGTAMFAAAVLLVALRPAARDDRASGQAASPGAAGGVLVTYADGKLPPCLLTRQEMEAIVGPLPGEPRSQPTGAGNMALCNYGEPASLRDPANQYSGLGIMVGTMTSFQVGSVAQAMSSYRRFLNNPQDVANLGDQAVVGGTFSISNLWVIKGDVWFEVNNVPLTIAKTIAAKILAHLGDGKIALPEEQWRAQAQLRAMGQGAIPAPAECRAEPAAPDRLRPLFYGHQSGFNSATPAPTMLADGPPPAGRRADAATTRAIAVTGRALAACAAAKEDLRVFGLVTDPMIALGFSREYVSDLSNPDKLDDAVRAILRTGISGRYPAPTLFGDAIVLPDGRVGGMFRDDWGAYFWVFARQGDRWLLDDAADCSEDACHWLAA